jgi:hypothetical protein
MLSRVSIVLVSALALAACGGDDSSLGSASDAFKESIRASCEKAHSCMSSYDPAMHNGDSFASSYGASADECYNMTLALIQAFLGADYFAKLDASVAAGRVSYNAADAQACLDAGNAQTCDQLFEQNGQDFTPPAVCQTAIRGTVATGGTCTIGDDCSAAADDCLDNMTCGPG